MTGKLTFPELKRLVEAGEIDTVVAAQVDMQGRLMGKRFQAEYFCESAFEETHSCNYLIATDLEMVPVDGYAATSWTSGYGDYVMKPDLETIRSLPWQEGTALVLCDVLDHHGYPVPHSPRAVLRRQVDRLADLSMRSYVATELEFYLFRNSYEDIADGAAPVPISAYNEDYHVFQTSKEEEVLRAVRTGLNGADIPVENSKGEADAGQAEINVRYADALTMADRHAILKNAVKEIAWSKGRAVTFMAKYATDAAGSSSHVHQSLVALDGTPLFRDADDPHGMSDLMRSYIAGQLKHASELTYFLAPYVNSYKRYIAGTFAPTKAVWSLDNRTAGYRVVGAQTDAIRIECRVGGADLNPYLAIAALLAAGMAGIEQKLQLEPAFDGSAYEGQGREIPKTLRAATESLHHSDMLRDALGSDVVDHYVHAARWEQSETDRHVTDWDVRRGFERG